MFGGGSNSSYGGGSGSGGQTQNQNAIRSSLSVAGSRVSFTSNSNSTPRQQQQYSALAGSSYTNSPYDAYSNANSNVNPSSSSTPFRSKYETQNSYNSPLTVGNGAQSAYTPGGNGGNILASGSPYGGGAYGNSVNNTNNAYGGASSPYYSNRMSGGYGGGGGGGAGPDPLSPSYSGYPYGYGYDSVSSPMSMANGYGGDPSSPMGMVANSPGANSSNGESERSKPKYVQSFLVDTLTGYHHNQQRASPGRQHIRSRSLSPPTKYGTSFGDEYGSGSAAAGGEYGSPSYGSPGSPRSPLPMMDDAPPTESLYQLSSNSPGPALVQPGPTGGMLGTASPSSPMAVDNAFGSNHLGINGIHRSPISSPTPQQPLSAATATTGGTGTSVTVFGFPPTASTYVLSTLRSLGDVINYRSEPGSNWMIVVYANRFAAQKALSLNGRLVADGAFMLGVTLTEPVTDLVASPTVINGRTTDSVTFGSPVSASASVPSSSTAGASSPTSPLSSLPNGFLKNKQQSQRTSTPTSSASASSSTLKQQQTPLSLHPKRSQSPLGGPSANGLVPGSTPPSLSRMAGGAGTGGARMMKESARDVRDTEDDIGVVKSDSLWSKVSEAIFGW
ncbi:Nucleoporin nup35 [Quaeritorhiza haematococci]|nr:Nucleoporin nup35 [Quaeritorhiza haematococci]